jgi:WD40 repeat protein
MSTPSNARVFISYARSDGAAFAARLRKRLQTEHPEITLWQDVISERAGRDWWLQITEALDHVEFMVLVMTPAAMRPEAENVRKEWRYARQQGVCVIPVQGAPRLDFATLPRWMRDKQFADLSVPEQWALFVADLTAPCQTPRVPFMVEDLPKEFVPRPAEFDALVSLLRDPKREEPIAMTAALQGAGGFGKTTLARALCHDPRIQEAFDDGILWVTLSENPGDLKLKVLDLVEVLSGERPGFQTEEAAGARLAELLADRDILMVIDDVWEAAHLAPFLRDPADKKARRCARLITTRNRDTLPADARTVNVDAMRQSEALELLRAGLPQRSLAQGSLAQGCPPELQPELRRLAALAARLGEWPILLKLVNGVLRERVEANQSLRDALEYVNADLDENGLATFDKRFDATDPKQRDQAIAATVRVSLKRLGEDQAGDQAGYGARYRDRYRELAIFPEDVDIPLSTVERLWSATGGLSKIKVEKLCGRLNRLSLLLRFDLATRTVRLHGVMRTYLAKQLADAPEIHAKLVGAWGDPHHLSDEYAWRWYAWHLRQAGRASALGELLIDFDWLQAKLDATDVTALIADYDLALDALDGRMHGAAPPRGSRTAAAAAGLALVQGALRLSAHVLARDKRQLAGQLTGRLLFQESPQARALVNKAAGWKGSPWLRPVTPSLTPPGGPLVRTLEGHSYGVKAVAITPDGRLAVSASEDRTLKVWELASGGLERTLEGHSSRVTAVAITPEGLQAVSGSDDWTLKVWDLASGTLERTLQGHSGEVRAVAITPDGRKAVSASNDQTLKVWDLTSGGLQRTLEGHSDAVTAVAITPDGRQAVSASYDQTLKVWDLASGGLERTLEGHSGGVWAVAITPGGGQVVSASYDQTLKVWDLANSGVERTLQGHSFVVRAVTITPDGGQVVSASDDQTLKVWDLASGGLERTLEGHSGWVTAVAITPDGRQAVSASDDRTLKVWDLASGGFERTLEGHSGGVEAVAITPDGRQAVSASDDQTLKVWDLASGGFERTLEGHSDWVEAVAITPDGRRAVSASHDRTLRVWDLASGRLQRTLKGHSEEVNAVAITPDGRQAISASQDRTLKVWGLARGGLRRTLKGHSGWVRAVAITPDGRQAVSGSADDTLKVWDLASGALERTLEGHSDWVNAVAITPDGRQAVSGSDDRTLKVWDLANGSVVATFTADAPLDACAVAPDGRTIVAGDSSGRVHFLSLELKEDN